ncbi:MAG: glutamate racemase [Ectothiorhodospiraceae bacterium]|nr:glutamate racemase [Ectothiorhodospiraceae bacterium]
MADPRPVGVVDSGVGGLSVLREIHALMPSESLTYVADAGFVPYGDRSAEEIRARLDVLTRFLVDGGVKALVVACNTATAAAVPRLRERLPLPIVGMEPAVKPAAAVTQNGVVGVLATQGTLASGRFAALLQRYAEGMRIVTQPCPGLVTAVERGELDTPATVRLLRSYLDPLLAQGVDTIILGCTHYPFLRPLLERLLDPGVRIIDTGAAVARQLQRRLVEAGLQASAEVPARVHYWTSGDGEVLRRFLRQYLPETLQGPVEGLSMGQEQGAGLRLARAER